MSTFGIIFAGWQCMDLLPRSLAPWITARKASGPHGFKIAAVCSPFMGFPSDETCDGTLSYLMARRDAGEIDFLVTSSQPLAETEARGRALRQLVDAGVTDLWQADADEMITTEEIERIATFWATRPHLCWARLSYKNRVFTSEQYLAKPFTPPRLHRVQAPGSPFRAGFFWDDNNVAYQATSHEVKYDTQFPSITVPPAIAFIEHETWLSNERSKKKCLYQSSRPGWKCDFDWDDARGGLIWREGLNPPEILRD